jgi:RNA polymerase sigma factor (sigma-70 family)
MREPEMPSMESISAQDVARAVGGDRGALERILRALERPFHALALRMMRSPDDAEDAAQECLVRVATRLAQFDGRSRFSTWAWRVAVNRILDYRDGAVRARLRFETHAAGLADGLEPAAPERPEDLVELGELKMRCSRALLQCLDADDRIAFVLGHILDVADVEAADILGTSPDAFRKRLSRARERLRDALDANCGIVNPAAPCRCHRRLRRARELGRVAPGVTTTEVPLDVAALRERLAGIAEARRTVEYYRADPTATARRDLVRAALKPLASR